MRWPELPSTLHATLVLFRLRFQLFRNTVWRGGWRRKFGWLLLAVLVALAFYGVFRLAAFSVETLRGPALRELLDAARREGIQNLPADVDALLARVPSLVVAGIMTLLLFTSFGGLLGALYLAGDMELLLAAPLPMRAVFVVKFAEALLPQTLLLLAFGLPLLLGLGLGMGYAPAFFGLAPLLLLISPLLPAGVAALLVMAVVRVLPARRARDITAALGGLLGMTFYVANLLAPEIVASGGGSWALEGLLRADLALLPHAWAGRAMVAAGERAWVPALALSTLFIGASLLVFAACLLAAERLYYAGWANVAASGGSARRRQQPSDQPLPLPWLARPLAWLPPPTLAILAKDLRVFPRDLRQLQQLIFPLTIAGIWTFRLVSTPPENEGLPYSLTALTSVGIAFFVCTSISNVLAGTGISAEGRSFWLLRLAPVSSAQILTAKFMVAYAPFLLLGLPLLFVLLALQSAPPADAFSGAALLLLVGLGVTGIGLGLGAAFPKFDWDNPQKMWSLRTGCLVPLCYFGYLALALGASLGLPLLAELRPLRAYTTPLILAGWSIAVALTALALVLPLRFGASRLERLEV
jgi:ABC-2 type transport system permease protein